MPYKKHLSAAEALVATGNARDLNLLEVRALADKYRHPEWEKAIEASACAECDSPDEVLEMARNAEAESYHTAIRLFIADRGLSPATSLAWHAWNDIVLPSIVKAVKG